MALPEKTKPDLIATKDTLQFIKSNNHPLVRINGLR